MWKSIEGLLEGRSKNKIHICFQDAEQVISCRGWGVKICTFFPSTFWNKVLLSTHTVVFFNFQCSLSEVHLVWWIRGPVWPWCVSWPERMGPLTPHSTGLCPRGGVRGAPLHPLGTRAIISGRWDTAAVLRTHRHLGLLPPQCQLCWSYTIKKERNFRIHIIHNLQQEIS